MVEFAAHFESCPEKDPSVTRSLYGTELTAQLYLAFISLISFL